MDKAMMTDAELTLLSLVAEAPRYGHEIQQLIDERALREWLTIGFSSIYYILNKLEKQNMVKSSLYDSGGRGPARKRYEITEAGQGILQTAISSLLRQPRPFGSGFELGLANLHVLKPQQAYRVLRYHRDDLKYQLDSIERAWSRHQEEDTPEIAEHIRALYTHSIAVMQSEIEWMESFIEDWAERYPAVLEELNKSNNHDDDVSQNTVTSLGHKTTLNRAKMLQKLKRPASKERDSESDDTPENE